MIAIYIVIILVQLGVIIYFMRPGTKQKVKPPITGDTYFDKRQLALSITPVHLKLMIPENTTMVYSVIMDWNIGTMAVTLATYITGAASMYLSTGGGVSSGGKDPNVGEAAVELVVNAQDFLERAIPAGTTDIPPEGCVRFYLLTNKGRYALQEHVRHFDDNTSPLATLFRKGNEVITEMQMGSVNN